MIGYLRDKNSEILETLNNKIHNTYNQNTKDLMSQTTNTIEMCQELQTDAKKRFESYYNRKQIIDYLIYINLAITPILLAILTYVLFIKK